MTDARVLVMDLECGELVPDRGKLYAIGHKWLGEKKVHTPSILDDNPPCGRCGLMKLGERPLLEKAHAVMSQADVLVTFNGTNFDVPWIQTKFLRERLKPLGDLRHIDLYQIARHKMRLSKKSLANISKYLRLKNQKTYLDFDIWQKAGEGDAKAMKYIRDHAAADVLVTEELYVDYLRPLIKNHPFMFEDREPCRRCGGRMNRDKRITTLSGPAKVQYVCKKCGGYETRRA